MNYYIQGDAANADKIKAAFEKLGMSDLNGYNFGNRLALFYTYDCGGSKVIATVCVSLHIADIIKTHHDYKELELPVQPKFKAGDWIVQNDNGTVSRITRTLNGKDEYGECRAYEHTNGYFAACFENEYHLWTIEDAKDGDVLVTAKIRSCPFIYRKICYENDLAYYYAGIDGNGDFCEGCIKRTLYNFGPVANVAPATKEQRDLLFQKMREAGYEWDGKKKELRKIKPHYDISNFHAGMPVLVRADNNCRWDYSVFSRITGNEDWQFAVCNGVSVAQCIPFDGNEKLLGTTDMCSEEYVNW